MSSSRRLRLGSAMASKGVMSDICLMSHITVNVYIGRAVTQHRHASALFRHERLAATITSRTHGGSAVEHHDLIVIGSGPAGRRAAIQAAKLGKKVLVVENRLRVGGVS